MSVSVIKICDCCGSEHRDNEVRYWACEHARCEFKIPPDGINGGFFAGILCRDCRVGIMEKITEYFDSKKAKP